MEFSEVIRQRESIRNYDPDKPLDQKTLERILEAGRMSPSAKNLQPWKFFVVSSPEMRKKVNAGYGREWLQDAPHILIVVGLKNEAWVRSFDNYCSIETDVTIAITQMILAAENEGVGTCWIEAYDPAILREALNLTGDQVIFAITPLGYPKAGFTKKGIKNRKSLHDIVEFL